MTEKSDIEEAPHPSTVDLHAPASSLSAKRPYARPELTSYQRADLGYYSASNTATRCQADCADNTCELIDTCSFAAPCTACDSLDECGSAPLPDCIPFPACDW